MRKCSWIVVVLVAGVLIVGTSAPAAAGGPDITKGGGTKTFFDDFVFELCGIPTQTTLTEKWTHKQFPDGSESLHVVRTFVPADTRYPIEKSAGTGFTEPDGTRRVVGKAIQLIDRPGGVRILDAGWVLFDPDGTIVEQRGPHPFLSADLVEAYCP